MAESGRSGIFVSDLGVGDLLALRRAGLEPAGQVFGATVVQITAPTWSGVSGELKILTGVVNNGWRTALARLTEEARLLGATQVLGIEMASTVRGKEEGLEVREFIVRGAGVRPIAGKPLAPDSPVPLATVHGAEYLALQQAGARPVGLAWGNCAYYRIADPPPGTPAPGSRPILPFLGPRRGPNLERTDYTEAVYNARRIAMQRLRQEAQNYRATGVVDVKVDVEKHPGAATGMFLDYFCHFFAVGTAVVHSRPNVPEVHVTLALDDSIDSLQPAGQATEIESKQKDRRRQKR